MYINIGYTKLIRKKEIVGIFDLDSASHEKDTRDFLKKSEKNGDLKTCGTDLPKAFVLAADERNKRSSTKNSTVYLTTLSSASLAGRNK